MEFGRLLGELRESAGLTQRQVAERMSANQTKVSRIENGDGDEGDLASFLGALGTPEASSLAELAQMSWHHLPRPSLRHPDLSSLVQIERGLDTVRNFLNDGEVSALLAGQAQLLEKRLLEAGEFLLSLEHDVVYVGEIGVGKTTAVCRQAGLVLDSATASDLKGMMLDTGGGRTTLCDVRVVSGDRFALTVEPTSDEEAYRLVGEMCRAVFEGSSAEAPTVQVDFKPPEEMERALRNMAGLPRPARARKGVASARDPLRELAATFDTLEAFSAEVAARLSLWRRRKRTIDFEGVDGTAGRHWLRTTFIAINNGRHDDFSIPDQITVTVPFALARGGSISLSVVDTRGVDGSAVRKDIIAHLKNPRAVTLLCSKWGSAPDPSSQALLTHVSDTNADRFLLDRISVVALARSGDAMSMRHDSGEPPTEIADGYEIKLSQVEDALEKIGFKGVEAVAYDASTDDPGTLNGFVLARIAAIRNRQLASALATIAAVDQMIANQAEAAAMAALAAVSEQLNRFADRNRDLVKPLRRPFELLLTNVTRLHARTVWAATTRSGRFWNFDVFQYIGDGTAAEAKARSSEITAGLNAIIESDLGDPELAAAATFLTQIRANIPQWEADFVNAVQHHAVAVYGAPLGKDQFLWDDCESEYGTGRGNYREGVAAKMRRWFDGTDPLLDELERRVSRSWITSVIEPLKNAVGSGILLERQVN
ncbi:MAG: helix-turn-helix domain-containing protein [Devosia sp.]